MKLTKIKVERISKKEGSTNTGTKSMPWVKYGILANNVWYGCFQKEYDNICQFNNTDTLKEGMEINVIIKEVLSKDGRSFYNIDVPGLQDQFNELKLEVEAIKKALKGNIKGQAETLVAGLKKNGYPDARIEDIEF